MRGLRPLVICVALLSGASAAQAQGETSDPAQSPSLEPGASPPVVDNRPAILGHGVWLLDFGASRLKAKVRGMPFRLGSSLDFDLTGDQFTGGTGGGGGCDSFGGTFVFGGDDELRLIFGSLAQGCGLRNAREIVDRLVNARHFELGDCSSPPVGLEADPGTTCRTLTLWGTYRSAAKDDLVYRSSLGD